jgi:serine/threonine protein kinase
LEATAGAVEAVHRAGPLHLDLKPSNILLDAPADAPWEQAFPKVNDFGIVRLQGDPRASSIGFDGPWGTPS